MWPFRKKMEVKFCDCGTDFCPKPGHMMQLQRGKLGVIITLVDLGSEGHNGPHLGGLWIRAEEE